MNWVFPVRAWRGALATIVLAFGVLVPGVLSPADGSASSGLRPVLGTDQITSGTTTPPRAGSNGWCLNDTRGSISAGNPLDVYQCNGSWSSQLWTVEDDGTVRIQNLCMDVRRGGTADGTMVVLDACNGSQGELWQPQADGALLNVNSGRCLGADKGDPVTNDAMLGIWTCNGSDTQVWHLPAASTAAATAAARLQLMYSSSSDLFQNGCSQSGAGNCWWWSANDLNALIDYAEEQIQATVQPTFPGSDAYLSDIRNTYHKGIGSYNSFVNGWYDDDGWWGLAWLNAYQLMLKEYGLTHSAVYLYASRQYLALAESLFKYIQNNAWDSGSCGGSGGVWQFAAGVGNGAPTKDATANELFLELAARLYLSTHIQTYLNAANSEWQWLNNSGLLDTVTNSNTGATGELVADHIDNSTCTADTSTQKWTDNQGIILGALADMYNITGDATKYLTPAENIAKTVIVDTQLVANQPAGTYSTPALVDLPSTGAPDGVLSEPCDATVSPGDWPGDCDVTGPHQYFLQYKGVFIRNLACLNNDTAGQPYSSFISSTANSVFANDQNTSTVGSGAQNLNQFGFLWDSWSTTVLNEATQGSALDALIAAMGQSYAMC